MAIELILNPKASGYERFQADLQQELAAFKTLSYRRVTQPPPPGVLSFEHEVVKFIFEHPTEGALVAKSAVDLAKETVRLATAIVETVRAIVERRRIQVDLKKPLIVMVVNNQILSLPSSPRKEVRFLTNLERASEKPGAKQAKKKKRRSR